MKFLNFFKKKRKYPIIFASLLLVQILYANQIKADLMESSSYKISTDSLNVGGEGSSSPSYNLNDTLGELATGDSGGTDYYMHAGYWQMQGSYIAISSPSDLVMSSMSGLSGGSSEGTMSWNVITDNTAGYSMSIAASTTPALKSANDSLTDYTPAGSDPDYNFNNPSTNSSFGFSPEGTEVIGRFLDNGSACNVGTSETTAKCWDGLSTTPKVIAGSTSSNQPDGSTITVRFRAESGADHIQISGEYNVTIIATATTL